MDTDTIISFGSPDGISFQNRDDIDQTARFLRQQNGNALPDGINALAVGAGQLAVDDVIVLFPHERSSRAGFRFSNTVGRSVFRTPIFSYSFIVLSIILFLGSTLRKRNVVEALTLTHFFKVGRPFLSAAVNVQPDCLRWDFLRQRFGMTYDFGGMSESLQNDTISLGELNKFFYFF